MKISIIVAASENNVIGRDNKLIWHLPNDLKHFKMLTTGNAVIMGRKTYESLGKPLPNRKNIILTRQPDYSIEGCIVVHNEEEALQKATGSNEVFIIGGSELYHSFWHRANVLYLTRIHTLVEGDTYIPPIHPDIWIEESRESHWADEKNGYNYSFITYRKNDASL
ncbi:Dihydrofolate reductase [termite gut metagenome]|uniref:dihydrofolate reductase n=1 Tax=termite gut metagenome TaxID=433724 RepID=A0A5J4SAH7_9ZZZZ